MIKQFVRLVAFSLLLTSLPAFSWSDAALIELSENWAEIKYRTPKDERIAAFEALSQEAEALAKANPDNAEPMVWQAIILSTLAGEKGGLGALSLVKQAKKLLEQAESMDADTLNGSIYTSLGSLYYQVPGWPLGFGNDKKAMSYLQKALEVNPDGIDSNYFYGDFMLQEKKYDQAVAALEKAMAAAPRANRPIADAGRRTEVEQALAEAKQHLQ
jgi:tetratricopeptide (TPR) repeat protein